MVWPIKITIKVVKPSDARGWIGLGCFLLAVGVLIMVAIDKSLLQEQAFLVLATALVLTGWVNGPVGWAYQATKGGGEAAESSARIAEEAAKRALPPVQKGAPSGTPDDPLSIEGAPGPDAEPVTTKGSKK